MRRLCGDRHKWTLSKGGSRSKAKGGGGGATTETPSTNAAQSAPSIPKGVTLDSGNPELQIYKYTTSEGNTLDFVVDKYGEYQGSVSFDVNGSSARQSNLSEREGIRIASKAKAIMKYDASQRPDGFIYTTQASIEDGLGEARVRLYERAGFSKPVYVGDTQYAIVRNGKLYPFDG